MRKSRVQGWLLLVSVLLACGGGQSRISKLQDAIQDLNVAARFGRMDVAHEFVASDAHADFAKHRRTWGNTVRVMDVEYQGMQMKDEDTAIVLVAIAWQRIDETDLRVTHLAQVWHFGDNGWKLASEERSSGSVGLLDEPMVVMHPDKKPDAHFPSITIR